MLVGSAVGCGSAVGMLVVGLTVGGKDSITVAVFVQDEPSRDKRHGGRVFQSDVEHGDVLKPPEGLPQSSGPPDVCAFDLCEVRQGNAGILHTQDHRVLAAAPMLKAVSVALPQLEPEGWVRRGFLRDNPCIRSAKEESAAFLHGDGKGDYRDGRREARRPGRWRPGSCKRRRSGGDVAWPRADQRRRP
eukprot:scaffold279_cov229-Pinguiococcus_pyrenoidosus.AAC.36